MASVHLDEPEPEPASAAQDQPEASAYLRISLSAQPLSKVRPEAETSRPELLVTEPVLPEVVRLRVKALEETVRPEPVKSVKASPFMVKVRPEVKVRLLATVVVIPEEPMVRAVAVAVPKDRVVPVKVSKESPTKAEE